MATANGKGQAHGSNLLAWRANSKRSQRCNIGDVDGATLQRCIDKVTAGGGAIMFGLTSDGGAFSVVVLYKNQKLKEYPNSVQALEGFLSDLADQFQNLTD